MSEVILHLSLPQKEAIEDSGLGNLLKIKKIHIYRDLCNEIARSYDKEKKAFNINEYLNLVDDVDKMRELNWSSLTLNQLLKGILKFREKETNIEGNICLLQVVDDIRGTIDCNEIPDEKAHDNDSETRSNEDFLCTSEEDNSNQSNHSRKRLIGPTGRTYQPTNRTDFIYETRGKTKDIIRTQAQTKKTIVTYAHVNGTNFRPFQVQTDKEANLPDTDELRGEKKRKQNNQTPNEISELYIEKEDLTPKIIDKGPPKNALRGQKKKKTNGQTPLKNSEELTKKEDPFITYINNTEDNKVMVHIEEVEVKRIRMKVLTQPEFLNDDVMDAYIQCLRYKEKGIRGDGKAFLEMAIKTGLLNVEGAHVEASKPRDK
uniref:Uncharacterized protein n=1 Tax=Oryza nivara TaxID=4536 RepID=A0A0E0HCL7_ORYNI